MIACCGLLLAACGALTGNPCSGLASDERGPTREKYLPCAQAMLEAMSRVDQGLERIADGEADARGAALNSWAELRSLVETAGGFKRLRGPWADSQVTEMNTKFCSAYEVYALEIWALANPVKRLRGEVSRHNVGLARREAEEARRLYVGLKQGEASALPARVRQP